MKKNLIILTVTLITICLFAACSGHHRHHGNLDLSVSESNRTYKLQAYYNEEKTGIVQRYINKQIEPNSLFASAGDYFDANTELKDRTRFHIKASPGRLEIKLNKRDNSYESYKRIKDMCDGIAVILKEQ